MWRLSDQIGVLIYKHNGQLFAIKLFLAYNEPSEQSGLLLVEKILNTGLPLFLAGAYTVFSGRGNSACLLTGVLLKGMRERG
jgi:hypothetical protein